MMGGNLYKADTIRPANIRCHRPIILNKTKQKNTLLALKTSRESLKDMTKETQNKINSWSADTTHGVPAEAQFSVFIKHLFITGMITSEEMWKEYDERFPN